MCFCVVGSRAKFGGGGETVNQYYDSHGYHHPILHLGTRLDQSAEREKRGVRNCLMSLPVLRLPLETWAGQVSPVAPFSRERQRIFLVCVE